MWARIQEMAIRREVPDALRPGSTVDGYTIGGRLPPIHGNRRYRATRDWRIYEVRQFFDVRTPAFLAWQHQARYATLPEHPHFIRACAEWNGGVILPLPRHPSLLSHIMDHPLDRNRALNLAHKLAVLLATLHRSGTAHLNFGPDSVLYDAKNSVPLLRHFGQSTRSGWQDIWGACPRPVGDWRYLPPAFIAGKAVEQSTDVYSFGGLLHLLLTGLPPTMLRGWSRWAALLQHIFKKNSPVGDIPTSVQKLMEACLDPTAANRPGMASVVRELESHVHTAFDTPDEIPLPPATAEHRLMVFIKPDPAAKALFRTALEQAAEHAEGKGAALLFVSIIPINLAYGEMEEFKARLFRTLAHGLRQCRERNQLWGLCLLENVDPERAAKGMVRQYAPDLVLCGTPEHKGMLSRLKKNLVGVLHRSDSPVCEVRPDEP